MSFNLLAMQAVRDPGTGTNHGFILLLAADQLNDAFLSQ